jgi:UDP:flavonoid glycosyltransferase YjiC (YdhE family)
MFTPTGDYPNITFPDLKSRSLNRLTHHLTRMITVWSSKFGFEHVRRRGELPKRKLYSPFDDDPTRPPTPILCAWSPRILPPSSDWSSNFQLTGYFFDDSYINYQPPIALQKFLKEGEPPVCITFGSMVNREAEKIDRIVIESITQTHYRGLILSGWSDVKNTLSNDLFYLDAVPHQWLLPRCKMVIHHGGAGTTAAGLRAGIPNVVIPFAADQPFWERECMRLARVPSQFLLKSFRWKI